MMKNKDVVICGLDLGSSRIKAVLGRHIKEKDAFEILAAESIYPTGIKSGVVSDMDVCAEAVGKILEKIESKTKTRFEHLFLTVSGSMINFDSAKGVCLLEKEKRISKTETEQAARSSVEFHLPLDRKLIQVIVKEYVIDGQGGILNPVGMLGRKIEARTVIFHSPLSIISNMIIAVEETGYTVTDIIASPQAQAECLLTVQEKESESVILEVGDQTTNFSCFKNNFLREAKSFDIGAGEIAKDLSGFYQIPYEYARQLSQRHFDLTQKKEEDSTEGILLKKENEEYQSISKRDFYLKGSEGANRLFAVIEKYLKEQGSGSNVVLCGGAVLIDGFSEKLEEYAGKVKIGRVVSEKIKFAEPAFNNPLFLNAVCGCVYGFKLSNEKLLARLKDHNFFGRLYLRIKDLLEDYF